MTPEASYINRSNVQTTYSMPNDQFTEEDLQDIHTHEQITNEQNTEGFNCNTATIYEHIPKYCNKTLNQKAKLCDKLTKKSYMTCMLISK